MKSYCSPFLNMTSMKQHDNNKLVKVFIMHFLYSIIRTLHFHHSSIRPTTSTVISWSSQSILGLKVSPLSVEVSNSKRKWITEGLKNQNNNDYTRPHEWVKDRQVCTAVRATIMGGWRPNEPIVAPHCAPSPSAGVIPSCFLAFTSVTAATCATLHEII